MPINVKINKNEIQDASAEILTGATGNIEFIYDEDINKLSANVEIPTVDLSNYYDKLEIDKKIININTASFPADSLTQDQINAIPTDASLIDPIARISDISAKVRYNESDITEDTVLTATQADQAFNILAIHGQSITVTLPDDVPDATVFTFRIPADSDTQALIKSTNGTVQNQQVFTLLPSHAITLVKKVFIEDGGELIIFWSAVNGYTPPKADPPATFVSCRTYAEMLANTSSGNSFINVARDEQQGDKPTTYLKRATVYTLLVVDGKAIATGDYVTQEEFKLFAANRANLVRANGTREYFTAYIAALAAAQSNDTVLIPAPIADPATVGNMEQLNVRPGVSVRTEGFSIGSPATRGDVITLRGGRGKLVCGGSTLYVNTGGGWGIGNYRGDGDTIDYDIEGVTIISQAEASCLTFQGSAQVRFQGELLVNSRGRALHNINSTFSGKGNITANGLGNSTLLCNGGNSSWQGNITLNDESNITLVNNAALHLNQCLVNGAKRNAGAELLVNHNGTGSNTLVLTDTTVLGTPGLPVITADKVVLRGSSVVIGTVQATTLIDERPASNTGTAVDGSKMLEFVFEPHTADNMTRTLGNRQATTYRTQQLQNVTSVYYKVNGTAIQLPFVVAAGDTLEVGILSTNADQVSLLTLEN